jgi:hypothetical protein
MMKKAVMVSLVTTVALSASSIDEAFTQGSMSGNIRLGYIQQENKSTSNTYATALGGILKYETAPWNDFKLGAAGYVSMKFPFASGSGENLNPDFFDSDGDSFIYLGEAYLDYSAHDVSLRIGRQLVNIPFADADDIRMLPNTFEGIMSTYSGIDKTTLTAGFLRRWAGYDSPMGHNDSINEFKKFAENHESNGVYLLGATNESIENLALQGWVYSIDKVTNIAYTDALYTLGINDTTKIELMAQYGYFDEDKNSDGLGAGIDGNVYGAGVNLNFGMMTLGVAMNRTFNEEGQYVINGLGGGPYYTSMEEMTIDGYEDVKAYQLSMELDMADAGIEGLTLTALYGDFKSTPADMKVKETDLIAAYEISEALMAEVSYAMVDDKNKNTLDDGSGTLYDGGYDRFLARISYNF